MSLRVFRFFKIIFTISGALLLFACEAAHDPAPAGRENVAGLETKISFEQIKKQILEPHCISCHTGQHRAYENYAVVKASAGQILARVTAESASRRMPPRQPALDPELIAMLKEWVEAGAPQEATATEEEAEDSNAAFVSFQDIKDQVLTPQCIQCHSHFNEFAVVKEQLGSIFGLVMEDKMPFPKRKGLPVTPLEKPLKDLLVQWVNAGAPYSELNPKGPDYSSDLKPNWISLRNNIFGPKCIKCHNSYGSRGVGFMENYDELLKWNESRKIFDFENPNNSRFIGGLLGRVNPENNEFFFDKMPLNIAADDVLTDIPELTEEEIQVVEKWIELKLPIFE